MPLTYMRIDELLRGISQLAEMMLRETAFIIFLLSC